MQVLYVHEFLTVLEAWVPRGGSLQQELSDEILCGSQCISLHSFLLILSIFITSLSEPAGQEADAD